MKKKAKRKVVKSVSKAKNGKKYSCDVCGMVVAVERECGCAACDILCCGQDMKVVGSCC